MELIRAYAANISFIDVQIGRILDQLEILNLTENTVIVFWGDHGFHLGEHGLWRKNTLFEDAIRSPLIISVPGQRTLNVTTESLVELIDIYPTICDLCQIPIPAEVEGQSMVPVIVDPTLPWKKAAFAQLRRTFGNSGFVDGHTMRTNQYRYTEWGNNGGNGIELYDYSIDPNETVNIANLTENKDLIQQLSVTLEAGWQSAIPEVIPTSGFKPKTLIWDVNGDGIVDMQDLLLVSDRFGANNIDNPKVDVNKDGIVDIVDLLLVAAHLGESSNGASPNKVPLNKSYISQVEKWLIVARALEDSSKILNKGIANLEILLNSVIVRKTRFVIKLS